MRFLGFNSLDALRVSIAAHLGANRAADAASAESRASRDDITPVIGRLLIDEARSNERRVAAFRTWLALVYLGMAVVDRMVGNEGAPPAVSAIAAAAAWTVVSMLLYVALRGDWYLPMLRRVIPLADALAIVIGATIATTARVRPEGTHAALAGNVALLCAALVFTGALRLTRIATFIASSLAVAAFFAVAIIVHLSPLPVVGILAGLVALSALSRLMTDATRRVVATEVEHLTMERQVERANTRVVEAQAASAAREEVLRIVAHDLRNPLGTLLMAADLLREPSMSNDLRAKNAAVIKRTGSRMNRLIQDLLNVARMDTGNLAIDPAPVAPIQLIANAIELMQPLAVEKKLMLVDETGVGGLSDAVGASGVDGVNRGGGGAPTLDDAPAVEGGSRVREVSAASDAVGVVTASRAAASPTAGTSATVDLPLVNVDAERIGQVFSNLIGNAIKFTPAGGKITLRADVSDGRVWFSVTDTGPGIPPEQVDHVFGEFWQARRTDRRGIGLGLTIAKGIVEAHGGVMGVSSEVGVGTRFWFGIRVVS